MKAMQYGHPKLRIKIPRSLVVTKMQRKLQIHFKDKAINRSNIKANHGDLFSSSRKSLGSVFFSVLANKRSSKVREDKVGRASSNELGDKPVVVAALSQLLALEENLEQVQAREEANRNRKDRLRLMMKLPVLRFLDKQKGLNKLMRAKSRMMFARLRQVRRKTCSCRLFKIPSKILVVGLKLKMVRPLVKKRIDEDQGVELWKKRILMGQRCKPLSSPVTLGFYSNSLFLPEMEP